jgi:hypothetical protein
MTNEEMADDVAALRIRVSELEARIGELGVLSEFAELVHSCLSALAEAVNELGGDVGLGDELLRIEEIANQLLQ